MLTPDSEMFKKVAGKNLRTVTESPTKAKRIITKRTREEADQQAKFDAGYLQIYDDDDKKLKDWSLNIPSIISDFEKSRLVWFMLEDLGLITEFSIDKQTLCEFILQIKAGYSLQKNAFHNYSHGITVMHSVHYILKHCGFAERFSGVMNLGILIAAFCHDVGHRGKSNIFEINSRSDVAITYHDRSVLEQYHAAYTFRILNKEPFNIFETLSPEDYKDIRKLIISCILSTDMKEHFEEVKNLKLLTEGLKQMEGADAPHLIKTTSKRNVKSNDSKQDNEAKQIEWSDDDIKLITGYILHTADLSGPTKAWDLAYYFSNQVNQEFIDQVAEEKALNLPIAPYMLNLDKPAVMAKSEIQFIKFIVKPLWDTFNEFVGDAMKIASDNLGDNVQHWETAYKNAIEAEELEKAKKAENDKKAENEKKPENDQKSESQQQASEQQVSDPKLTEKEKTSEDKEAEGS